MAEGAGAYRPNSKTTLRNIRRAVQLICLALWVALFLAARHQALALIPPDLFLMTDPLVAAVTMGAAHVFVPIMLTSLFFVVVGLVLGRVFCGWICPLGTLIDAMGKVFNPPEERFSLRTHQRMQRWKYYVLAFVVFGALLSSQWVYLLDPLVVLFRGVAAGVYPLLGTDFQEIVFLPLGLLAAILQQNLSASKARFWQRKFLLPFAIILGVLAAVAIPNIAKFMNEGEEEAGVTELANVQTAMIAGMVDAGVTQVVSFQEDPRHGEEEPLFLQKPIILHPGPSNFLAGAEPKTVEELFLRQR